MAVLIDPPLWPAHGRRWSHLASDSSLRELHEFAARLGIPGRGFEGDHYDVPEERYADVVAAGALPVSGRELLRRLRESGLRRPKRRGERVLDSRPVGPGLRLDALLSALPPLGPVSAVHVLVVAGRRLLALPDGVGYRLPAHTLGPGEEGPADSAASLVAALLGGVAPAGLSAPSQVGYLRRVGPGGGHAVDNEVVLRFVLDGGAPAPTGGSEWVPAQQAVALVEGPIAVLAAGGAYHSPSGPFPGPSGRSSGRQPGRPSGRPRGRPQGR